MPNLSKVFGIVRVAILGAVSLLSLLTLIMAALITAYYPYNFSILGIAVATLTLITVPVMLVLSLTRKGAFPSMIVVEITYTSILWVLWLGTGGTVGNVPGLSNCYQFSYYPGLVPACMQAQAMAAFSFLNWLLLMTHAIFLLTLAAVQSGRGNHVWTRCVTDVDFSASSSHTPAPQPMVMDGKSPYSAASTTLPGSPQPYIPQQSPQPYVSPQQYPPQQGYPVQQPYPVQQSYPVQQPYPAQQGQVAQV